MKKETNDKKNESKSFDKLMNDTQEGVFKLAPGLTSEEMIAVFFNDDALVESPVQVYRLQGTKDRYYYTFNEDESVNFFTSVTTMIKYTMPTSPFLIKWIAEMGYDESRNYAQERAYYGTFMHTEISELAISRIYDISKLRGKLKQYIEQHKLPSDFINHEDELKKDLLSFAQFMIDYKVKPLAIEIVLTHPEDGYAGAIDMPCKMTIQVDGLDEKNVYKSGQRKDQPREIKVDKEITAIVDFKSGRKGFFEEHEVQLQAYKNMWDIHFTSTPIDKIYNWAPKNWRKSPTYSLKDQTDSKSREKLQHLVEIARIENKRKNNSVVIVDGVIDLAKGIDSNISEILFDDLVKKNRDKKTNKKTKK